MSPYRPYMFVTKIGASAENASHTRASDDAARVNAAVRGAPLSRPPSPLKGIPKRDGESRAFRASAGKEPQCRRRILV